MQSSRRPGPLPGREQDAALAMRVLIASWSALAAFGVDAGLLLDPAVVALRGSDDAFNEALVIAPDLEAVGRTGAWFGDRPWRAWSSSEETSTMLAALGHRPVGGRVAMVAPTASAEPRADGFREAAAGEVLELAGIPRESLGAGSGLVAVLTADSGTGALLFPAETAAGVSHLAVRHDADDRRAAVLQEALRAAAVRGLPSVTCLADADDEDLYRAAGFEPVARWVVSAAPPPA